MLTDFPSTIPGSFTMIRHEADKLSLRNLPKVSKRDKQYSKCFIALGAGSHTQTAFKLSHTNSSGHRVPDQKLNNCPYKYRRQVFIDILFTAMVMKELLSVWLQAYQRVQSKVCKHSVYSQRYSLNC